jgi:serine/threonine-protein kinase
MGSQDKELIGTTVGNYKLLKRLGAGGMGVVYLGVQPSIRSLVAVKVIAGNVVNEELTKRFFAEARTVNLIRHESIVNVLDLCTLEDGRPCIVMEFLEGAHLAGVIHRGKDLWVTPTGRAKILDFGLCKLVEQQDDLSLTMAGVVMGTTPYMSPEQARGDDLDARSDIFAVGVILYEALTGRRPFQGWSVPELLEEQRQSLLEPRMRRREIGERLNSVIMQAMEIDRDKRFQSARALRQALATAIDDLGPEAMLPLPVASVSERIPTQFLEALEIPATPEGPPPSSERPTAAESPNARVQGDSPRQLPRDEWRAQRLRRWLAAGGVAVGVLFLIGVFVALLDDDAGQEPMSSDTAALKVSAASATVEDSSEQQERRQQGDAPTSEDVTVDLENRHRAMREDVTGVAVGQVVASAVEPTPSTVAYNVRENHVRDLDDCHRLLHDTGSRRVTEAKVSILIGLEGRTSDVDTSSNVLGLNLCLNRAARKWQFPTPRSEDGAPLVARYVVPLTFGEYVEKVRAEVPPKRVVSETRKKKTSRTTRGSAAPKRSKKPRRGDSGYTIDPFNSADSSRKKPSRRLRDTGDIVRPDF